MEFSKYHGLGNDFIIVEDMALSLPVDGELARRLCHRRLGIGADGLVLARPSSAADIRMDIYNSDGSAAGMCGNAIRCFAKYAHARGLVSGDSLRVETPSGIREARLEISSGQVRAVEVDMGEPAFDRASIPMLGAGECIMEAVVAGGRGFTCSAVNTGVPHLAVFLEDITEAEILHYGPLLEGHSLFPSRTNVDFVRVLDGRTLRVDTYERGCGRTPACGTGACAAAVCAARAGLTGREVEALLTHGALRIAWREDGRVYMKGPAQEVYAGELCSFFWKKEPKKQYFS